MSNLQIKVDALFQRTVHGIRPGLDVIGALLEKLDHPERSFHVIHVAGTNGKGSVCAMIESVLRASGFKTGLFTSPHLFRFNERIRVNGQNITDSDLEKLIADIEPIAQSLDTRPATFFEMSTAMAFEYFKQSGVDYAVIETGMGGRWDATNGVHPILSVITRIDLDHAEFLGSELGKVAGEKAGIIKEGVPVICGPMPVEAEAVIYKEAAEKNAPILGSDEAVFFEVLESRRTDQLLNIEASGNVYRSVLLPLGGSFQLENCGIAVAALEDVADLQSIRLQMKKGLEAVKWPGRFQTLSMKPPVLFDAAHNPSAARALAVSVKEIFPSFECGFVFGFMKDKDVEGFLREIASVAGPAWAVTLPGERAMTAEKIAEIGKGIGLTIEPVTSFEPARQWGEGKQRLLCFTGSFYLAEVLKKQGIFHV